MKTRVLNDDQILCIHRASIRMLRQTGVVIPHEEMLNSFEASGALVDKKEQRVYIPESLIMGCVASASKQFTIYGRDKKKTAIFGSGKRNYNSSGGEASWIDTIGMERRYTYLEDVVHATQFCDALENINVVGAMSDPIDVPVAYRCVEVLAAQIKNTTKPVTFWFHDRASARFIVDMIIALRGDKARAEKYPICYPFLEPISPMRFPYDGIDLLYETARINLPVSIGPMAQMGVSAPMSVAGTMAQENAEVLAGICVTQLVKKGMPVCYGGICHAFDMGTTQMIFGGPEQAIFGVGMTQMGKYYGLPVYINVGLTDSKCPDAQAGLESGVTLAMGAAAGADIFGHMGICGVDQGTSLDILNLQNEIISYVESLMRTLDFSDEALGIDLLDKIGPGGSFLSTEQTALRFKDELWFPKILDRKYYQEWLDNGATTTKDRCTSNREQLMAAYEPEPLDKDTLQAVDDIVSGAKRELN